MYHKVGKIDRTEAHKDKCKITGNITKKIIKNPAVKYRVKIKCLENYFELTG